MANPVVVLGVSVSLDQASIGQLKAQLNSLTNSLQTNKGIIKFIDPNEYANAKRLVADFINEVSKTSGPANASTFAKGLLQRQLGLTPESARALVSDANKLIIDEFGKQSAAASQAQKDRANNQSEFQSYVTAAKIFTVGNVFNRLGLPAIGNAASDIGSAVQVLGSSMGIAGAAIAGFGLSAVSTFAAISKESIKLSADIQTSMTRIAALTGVARESLDSLYTGVAELSSTTGKSQKELADALYFITSSGFKDKTALDVLAVSAKASAAGLGEVKTVADVVTSALNAYRGAGYDAAKVTDILIATIREGKAEPEQLARSLGQVLPIAKAAGLSLEEVSSAVAALTVNGLGAPNAVTATKQAIQSLVAPSKEAALALDQIYGSGKGVAVVAEKLKTIGLVGTLKEIFTAFGNNNVALDAIFGNIRGLVGALALSNDGFRQFEGILKEVNGSLGATDQAFSITVSTFESGAARLDTAAKNAIVSFGLLSTATTAVNIITAAIKDLSGQSASIEKTLIHIGSDSNKSSLDQIKTQFDLATSEEKKTIRELYKKRSAELSEEISKVASEISAISPSDSNAKTRAILLQKQLNSLTNTKDFYDGLITDNSDVIEAKSKVDDYLSKRIEIENSIQSAIQKYNAGDTSTGDVLSTGNGRRFFVKGDVKDLFDLEKQRIELQMKAFDEYTSASLKSYDQQISNIRKLIVEGEKYESYLDKLDKAQEKLRQTPPVVQASTGKAKKPPTAGQVAKAVTELGDTADDIKKINASKKLTDAQKADRIAQQNLIDERARDVLSRASQSDIKTARAQFVNNPKYAKALEEYIAAQEAVLKEQFNQTTTDVSQLSDELGKNIVSSISKSIASGVRSSAQGIKIFDQAFGPIKSALTDGLINLAHDAGLTATRGFQYAFGSELAKISLTDQIKKLTDQFTNGLITEAEYNVRLKPLLQLFYSKDDIVAQALKPIEGFLKDTKTITFDALVAANIVIDEKSAIAQVDAARKQLRQLETFQGKNGGIDNYVKDFKEQAAIDVIQKVNLKLEFSKDIKNLLAEGSQPEAIAKIAEQLIGDAFTAKGITVDASKIKAALSGTLGIDQASVSQSVQDAIVKNQGEISAKLQPTIAIEGGGTITVGDDLYNSVIKAIQDQMSKPITVSPTINVTPLAPPEPSKDGGTNKGGGGAYYSPVKPTKEVSLEITNDISAETKKIDDQFAVWSATFSTQGSIAKAIDFEFAGDIEDEWNKLFELYETGKKRFERNDLVAKQIDFTLSTDLQEEVNKLVAAIDSSLATIAANPKTIEQTVNVVYKINASPPSVPTPNATDASDRRGYASGGEVPVSGTYWVGEQGKELVYLPRGSFVLNANDATKFNQGLTTGRYSDVRQSINNVGPTSNVKYEIDARHSQSPIQTYDAVKRAISAADQERIAIRRSRETGRR